MDKADVQFTAFDSDNNILEDAIISSVVIGHSSSDDIHNISDLPDDYSGGLPNTDEFYFSSLYIQFQPKVDIDHLDFILGFPSIGINEVQDDNKHLGNNEFYDYSVYLGISDFSVTEISEFFAVPHGGGGISLDKPSKDDESIFSDLKSCNATDIGCHFDNLMTMIKSIFTRIGNFFTSIWEAIVSIGEFFVDFFVRLGKFFIDLFKSLFIPDSDDVKDTFDTLSTFLNNKLGFLVFPFDFIINFLNRFINLPNEPVKIITVPTVTLGSFGTLIPGFTFNFSDYWEQPPFDQIYNIYLIFVHAFIGFGLYNLSLKKFNEIVGGAKN